MDEESRDIRHLYLPVRLLRGAFHDALWEGCFLTLMLLASFGIPLSVHAQECGSVWTESAQTPPYPYPSNLPGVYTNALANNGSRFVLVGTDGRNLSNYPDVVRETKIWTSDDDGEHWTARHDGVPDYHTLFDVVYNGSTFVTVGVGAILTSSDGITWSERDYPFSSNTFCRTVIWDGSQFMAGFDNGKVGTSPTGAVWTTGATFCDRVASLSYGNGVYISNEYSMNISVGNPNEPRVFSSTNGTTWTQRVQMVNYYLGSSCFGNGMFLLPIKNKTTKVQSLLTSSDGLSWTQRSWPFPVSGEMQFLGYDGDIFRAVVEDSVPEDHMLTSEDGLTWAQQTILSMNYGWSSIDHKVQNGERVILLSGYGRPPSETINKPRIVISKCYPVPVVTEHPEDPLPCNNGSGQFCVTVAGAPPLSYQWERDVGGGWGNISGAQSTCYTISPVSTADEGQYRCRVWNDKGTVTSNSASLTVRFPPTSLSEQPANQDVCEFESPEFCVTASDGTPPLSYQWERNTGSGWGDVPDGDERCLTVSDVDPAENEDQYRCRVWNDCGTITSDPATLEVHARAKADFDCDDDVDQDDFGHFQGCLSGSGIEQDDPICADARLDGDTDVDAADFAKFLNCLSGPDVPANVDCAD